MVGEADVRSVFFFALRHLHLDAGEQTHQELDDGTDISTGCLEEQCVCACVCVWHGAWGVVHVVWDVGMACCAAGS